MPSKSFAFLATAIALLPHVSAHGNIQKVVAGDQVTIALDPYNPQGSSAVRVMLTNSDPNAFVEPWAWTDNAKMSCPDAGNRPAAEHLIVPAGSTVDIFWQGASSELRGQEGAGYVSDRDPWNHAMGPMLTYLADCYGDCTTYDATNAGWVKIHEMGIDMGQSPTPALRSAMQQKGEPYYPQSGNGLWAAAKLIQDASVWRVAIPKELKDGRYIMRHELSAMHSPQKNQNYIGCIQLDVVNGGSTPLPQGTQAKDLYDTNGQFVNFNVYADDFNTFQTPGPQLWTPSGARRREAKLALTSPAAGTKRHRRRLSDDH